MTDDNFNEYANTVIYKIVCNDDNIKDKRHLCG